MEKDPKDEESWPPRRPGDKSSDITLRRALGLGQTVFLGIGTAIGAVVFAIMGKAYDATGPSIVVTFVIGAFFAFLTGLSYAELGSAVPQGAGGAVSFVRRAYGNSVATSVAGWFSWVGSITDSAIGAIVFGFSINYFLKWVEPYTLAAVTLVLFAFITFRGAEATSVVQSVLTLILIAVLGLFITGGILGFGTQRFDPMFPKGIFPAVATISYIFPTYAGYESITQLSEEVKTAGKTIPRAFFLSLVGISILFTGTAIALVGSTPPQIYVGTDTPLQEAARYLFGPAGAIVISVGSIVATLSTINGCMAGGTRIAYALGRNNLLPSSLSKVHPRYRSPYLSLILTTLVAIVFVLTRSIDLIVYVVALGYNVTSIIVSLSLIRLRKTEPLLYRPFKVPLYPYLTVVGMAVSCLMIATMSVQSLIFGVLFGVLGIGAFRLTKKMKK